MPTAVCSVISPNYRPFARVLMSSVRTHQPEWDRFVLVVGGPADIGEEEPFETVAVDALGLPDPPDLTFRYTMLELDTAVKPWLIAHLFDRGYDRVVYLDPDIVVYSRLAELDRDGQPFITLTPHLTTPVEDAVQNGGHARERSILIAGVWNLGFIAITRDPQLDAFLAWWKGRLIRECVVEPEIGLFVEQKWVDLVPGFFDRVVALRHEGYNVAYWNLRQRPVTRDDDGSFSVNGGPLRFFHFSGFDPSLPGLVSKHDVSQKAAASGDAALLFDRYARAVKAAGHSSLRQAGYSYGAFHDGSRVTDAMRVAYRRSPRLQADAAGNPFAYPELFHGTEEPKPPPVMARMKYRAYHVLSRARPLVRLLPLRLRAAMREGLLGRDP
ncbi:MAG TPA: group 1 glycosyl transferase [Thermoanaerobaculia bacterium]|jgi:hypothetical protein